MPPPAMIALAVHSHFSLMRGTASMRALCRRARELGYSTLGLSDIDNLYSLWPFLRACREESITPLIGAEISGGPGRIFCFVRDATGYRNLCRLLSARHRQADFFPERDLPGHSSGLWVLCDHGGLLRTWRGQVTHLAAALMGKPDQHGSVLRRLAAGLGLPVVALADVFFLQAEDQRRQRLLRAIACNTSLSRLPQTESSPPDRFLAPPDVAARRFALWPESIKAAHLIAEQCCFRGPDFGLILPPYTEQGQRIDRAGADQLLRQAAFSGARERYGDKLPQPVAARLEHELRIIADKGFSSYFLVVRDITAPVSRTCGRGSGAASLVAYCLHITNVCPVRHNLYFERFLNPGRQDPPDIDIDFAWDERDQVLAGVFSRHGEHAAMVCNHVLLQPRMAIREVAKVYGLPEGEINRISKKLPWIWRAKEDSGDLLAQLRNLPQLREESLEDPWPAILADARSISGIPRTLSVHPGGVVITPRPVSDYVPVQTAAKGVPLLQWDKDGAEEAGLVKIDLLGNRSLGVIRDAITQLRDNGGILDENTWQPEEDPCTQDLVARGRTMGCFYIESPAMRLLQQKAGQGDFAHLVIHSSIIRPAANEWIREYLRRLHGGSWQSLHPLLDGVLDETFGIMVYQEDVSRVAVAFGFSHTEADRLRKIMSKKDRELRLADYERQFRRLAAERGVTGEAAETIWRMLCSFDGYSFCKAHSASYARVSFQAAWLKAHYPAEFMAAVISNQGGYYSTFAYVSEARRLGLTILPPDVNRADRHWRGQQRELRVGLMAVRDLSGATLECILKERENKLFDSTEDFFRRVRPGVDEARALIHAGGLDALEDAAGATVNRGLLFWRLAHWQQTRPRHKPGPRSAQATLTPIFARAPAPPALPPEDPLHRLRQEYQTLGFLCAHHPITLFDRGHIGATPAKDLPHLAGSACRVRFLGWLVTGKIVGTKSGEVMEFLTFEDETAQVECTFFPGVYRRCCHLLYSKGPLLLEGFVEAEFGAATLTVEQALRPPGLPRHGVTSPVGGGPAGIG